MNRLVVSAAVAAIFSCAAVADSEQYQARVDEHAPIGVMADHFHKKGDVMFSLRGMSMSMDDPVNEMMGAQSMKMKMAMAGMMYAPSDHVTFAAMVNYVDTSMDMIMMNHTMDMGVSNIGDLRLNAIIPLVNKEDRRFHISLGASVPTGSVDALSSMGTRMALTMQAGTGSWGITPSATYSQFFESWSYGVQANGKFWLEDNDFGEQMGDELEVTSWAAIQLTEKVSFSGRVSYLDRGAVSGSMMTNLTDAREVLRGFAGINTVFAGHRFAVEAGLPIWQDQGLNALKSGFTLTVGWQKAF